MKTGLFFAGLLFCGLVALLGTADAVTYKYIDKAGQLCFADDLQVIPEQYRSQAVLIEGELKEKPGSTAATGTAIPSVMRPDVPPQPLSIRMLITLCVGLAVLALTALISKQLAGEEQQRVRAFAKRGALAFFIVYLLLAHGRDVRTAVHMADRTLYEVQQGSVRKGQKAAEGIKRLDALFDEMQKAEGAFKKEEEASYNR
jgi:hypothetical protein